MTTRREGAAPAALGRLAAALGVAAAIGLAGVALDAQPALKPLSIDAIYDPLTRANFSGAVPQVSWLDDTTYLLRRPGATWQRVNAPSGVAAPLYDATAMESALAALPGVSRSDASEASRAPLEFNAAYTRDPIGGYEYQYSGE